MTESTTTPKAKKASKPKAAKKAADHPKYEEMIKAAIAALADRKGSSRQAILKYIKEQYKVGDNSGVHLKMALKRGVAAGKFAQVKGTGASGSFKNSKANQEAKPKPKKVVKKKPAAKKTTTKKAGAAKKKTEKKKTEKKKKTVKKSPAKKTVKKSPAKKAAGKKSAAKKASPKKPTKKPAAKKGKKSAKK